MPSSSPTDSATHSPDSVSPALFVVATPIGNMEDITLRALRVLKAVDVVAAEDTRHTRKLLSYYDIHARLVSYHEYNKEKRTPELLKTLKAGMSIALVTDAGTPSISDPGQYLVREAIRAGVSIVPIPGPCAAIAALSVSALPTDSFVFIGFISRKQSKARRLFEELKAQPRTLVFYESPKRLLDLMKSLLQVLGDREAVVARELTKRYEELLRGNLTGLIDEVAARPLVKGECTLLVAPSAQGKAPLSRQDIRAMLEPLLHDTGRSLVDAVKVVVQASGCSRKVVYEEAVKLRDGR